MDKNAIKKYAVWARTELITRVSQRAEKYDITAEADVNASSVNGVLLSDAEKKQRKALIEQVKQKGFDQVMEEVAYTWFNRFIALRFMEVNGYLPSHIRVFTDDNNNFKPQILAEAIHLELDGLDMEKVFEMKNNSENDELYKYLIITQCNNLSNILPGMFQKLADYSELLFPDNILRENSIIEQMIVLIPEEDWKDEVQIIGWLYQFYNIELKAKVFGRPAKEKVKKEEIPAATQLFTPDWIVRYMVENALGSLWCDNSSDSKELYNKWEFFIKSPSFNGAKLNIQPQNIKCIDPCIGSGHVCVYMFDALMDIYREYGISEREAVENIVSNNIYGLDIDNRAAQLAYFAIMMKARQYDRRFFTKRIQPNIYAIKDSATIDKDVTGYFCGNDDKLKKDIQLLLNNMEYAKEMGSLSPITAVDYNHLNNRIEEIKEDTSLFRDIAIRELVPIIKVAEILANKYDVVVTNPPYLGNKNLGNVIGKYLKDNKLTNLYQAMLLRCINIIKNTGYLSMVTMNDWLKKSKLESFRREIFNNQVLSMFDLGAGAFEEISGEIVQVCIFTIKRCRQNGMLGIYADLTNESDKMQAFLSHNNEHMLDQELFENVPRYSIVPSVSDEDLKFFEECKLLDYYAKPRSGLTTGDKGRFIHYWHEVAYPSIGSKWFPVNTAGSRRRWYGIYTEVIDWENDGAEIKNMPGSTLANMDYQMTGGLTWGKIGSGNLYVRYSDPAFFTATGLMAFPSDDYLYYTLALMNSAVSAHFIKYFASGVDVLSGDVANIPMIEVHKIPERVISLAKENVELSREDWDSFEISPDFKSHPLVRGEGVISDYYEQWEKECNHRYCLVKKNEDEIDQLLTEVYKMPSVESEREDVAIRKADLERDIKSLISYAVGCMFGRYSTKRDGIQYAGGEFDSAFLHENDIDVDNIIPICDDQYFDDDIVERFVRFIEDSFGKDNLEINLAFIARVLGGEGSSRDIIRDYFINDFYSDHVKIYQKCPIYWQFDSGKKNGFKCLIYIHRYKSDALARIRTDYIHELQSRYRTAIEELENRRNLVEGSKKIDVKKRLDHIKEQNIELQQYEEKIHHLADQYIEVDMNKGVLPNYDLFGDVLAKV